MGSRRRCRSSRGCGWDRHRGAVACLLVCSLVLVAAAFGEPAGPLLLAVRLLRDEGHMGWPGSIISSARRG